MALTGECTQAVNAARSLCADGGLTLPSSEPQAVRDFLNDQINSGRITGNAAEAMRGIIKRLDVNC